MTGRPKTCLIKSLGVFFDAMSGLGARQQGNP
eukprot:CAMPEP_0171094758 /NCGR_PEP_ID=MMETSP0766_2-20121228/42290_1 /TAXON_ID=439317 /ORGANISM="Gambierdiscus australes, Strain CAWD 149" /LENGTH=31 /DNA_ID= /DNA_START= /DNA_END= /DNA_ORIENTATION=